MNDADLLKLTLASTKITDRERAAFVDMEKKLARTLSLTTNQRAWLQAVAARLGINVPSIREPVVRASAWDPAPIKRKRRR